ncbi:MAG: glycosyltransferase family 2 protein [Bdellovibrionales bacterium]|nr:glycosyltransferase family 2 protein [Bdellovibrionales bacterium]
MSQGNTGSTDQSVLAITELLAGCTWLSPKPTSTTEHPPLISVIIPCYKQAEFLTEAVESVVRQTFSNWECLIINDGSPDNTSRVARDLIAKYPESNIRLLEKTNGGLSDARNYGIRHSHGRYILPLDCDDKLDRRMLEKSVALLEQDSDIGFIYTHMQTFGLENVLHYNGDFSLELVKEANRNPYCSLYRKKIWEENGGYNTNLDSYEDWDFWIGAAERGYKGKLLPEPLFYYRTKPNSMLTEALKRHDKLVAQIALNHPEAFGPERVQAARTYLSGLEKESQEPQC